MKTQPTGYIKSSNARLLNPIDWLGDIIAWVLTRNSRLQDAVVYAMLAEIRKGGLFAHQLNCSLREGGRIK